MTELLFLQDAYQREHRCLVTAHTPEGGLVLERSIFYPTGGGQPGDSGTIHWQSGQLKVATTVKGHDGAVVLLRRNLGASHLWGLRFFKTWTGIGATA